MENIKKQKLIEILNRLTSYPSVSGNESALHACVKDLLAGQADKVEVDSKSNLIAYKGKTPKVALFAHADKIGFMVQGRHSSHQYNVVAMKKSLKTTFSSGPIGPIEITHRSESQSFTDGLLVNIAQPTEAADLVVEPDCIKEVNMGDLVSYKSNFFYHDDLITSQGLDNKAGLLVAIQAFKQAKSCILVASAQEEIPSKAVALAAAFLKPKIGLVVDVTYAEGEVKLGSGVTICLKDSSLPDWNLAKNLIGIATHFKIPIQKEVLLEGTSDFGAIESASPSSSLCFVGIPLQGMHSAQEKINIGDLVQAIDLLTSFIEEENVGN